MSDTWEEIPSESFESRWGTDFFVKTVLGHTYADVLRELAQNEFDAHGRAMSIELGKESLVIRGHGDVIDPDGWHRLSVIFGTGDIAGTHEHVEAKQNGIGSMNFGLRSLFLFGDQIRIASGGLRTELRFPDRAPDHPLPHGPSRNKAGVVIEVPFRTDDGSLPAFDLQREHEALDVAAREFAPTFMKLARPRTDKSLNEVTITSARLDRELRWRQSVQIDPRATGMLRRRVDTRQTGFDSQSFPGSSSEVEFGRSVKVPSRLRGHPL